MMMYCFCYIFDFVVKQQSTINTGQLLNDNDLCRHPVYGPQKVAVSDVTQAASEKNKKYGRSL
jgi:ribosomal protein L31